MWKTFLPVFVLEIDKITSGGMKSRGLGQRFGLHLWRKRMGIMLNENGHALLRVQTPCPSLKVFTWGRKN